MNEVPASLVISVRQRLLNGAHERGEEFQRTLTRYAIERLLYRLSQSSHREAFILKGATLFAIWVKEGIKDVYRPTRDVDFLGCGSSSQQAMIKAFREIAMMPVDLDGLIFDAKSVTAELIREDELYEGCRLNLAAYLGKARIPLQIDVGFGDAITPEPEKADYPTLLSFPAPRLRVYPRETVIAEKFEAMVKLGIANSRMKDFFDVWLLAEQFTFDGPTLCRALSATFTRRGTALPEEVPLALTPQFSRDRAKIAAWQAFVQRNTLEAPELDVVITRLQNFLITPLSAGRNGETFTAQWQPHGGWLTNHKTNLRT